MQNTRINQLVFSILQNQTKGSSLMVMAGVFKEATSGVGCEQIMAAWSIPTPPVRADYMPININPADGAKVYSGGQTWTAFLQRNP